MAALSEDLTPERLRVALAGNPFVTEVLYRPRLGSTNSLAKEQAERGAAEGLLVITDQQTAGRGRLGRRWWAPPGSALLTSLLFRPSLPPAKVQQLTMLCALAAVDAIAKTTDLSVGLKWPNDLMFRGRKLAGILTEAAFKGDQLDFVIVGLGINVNVDFQDAPPLMTPATSLQRELGRPTGRPVDRLRLLILYLDRVAQRYTRLEAGHSPHSEWADRLITLGQLVTARLSDGRRLTGLAEDVAEDGALLLRASDGTIRRLHAADVSLRDDLDPAQPGQVKR